MNLKLLVLFFAVKLIKTSLTSSTVIPHHVLSKSVENTTKKSLYDLQRDMPDLHTHSIRSKQDREQLSNYELVANNPGYKESVLNNNDSNESGGVKSKKKIVRIVYRRRYKGKAREGAAKQTHRDLTSEKGVSNQITKRSRYLQNLQKLLINNYRTNPNSALLVKQFKNFAESQGNEEEKYFKNVKENYEKEENYANGYEFGDSQNIGDISKDYEIEVKSNGKKSQKVKDDKAFKVKALKHVFGPNKDTWRNKASNENRNSKENIENSNEGKVAGDVYLEPIVESIPLKQEPAAEGTAIAITDGPRETEDNNEEFNNQKVVSVTKPTETVHIDENVEEKIAELLVKNICQTARKVLSHNVDTSIVIKITQVLDKLKDISKKSTENYNEDFKDEKLSLLQDMKEKEATEDTDYSINNILKEPLEKKKKHRHKKINAYPIEVYNHETDFRNNHVLLSINDVTRIISRIPKNERYKYRIVLNKYNGQFIVKNIYDNSEPYLMFELINEIINHEKYNGGGWYKSNQKRPKAPHKYKWISTNVNPFSFENHHNVYDENAYYLPFEYWEKEPYGIGQATDFTVRGFQKKKQRIIGTDFNWQMF